MSCARSIEFAPMRDCNAKHNTIISTVSGNCLAFSAGTFMVSGLAFDLVPWQCSSYTPTAGKNFYGHMPFAEVAACRRVVF